MQLKFLVTALLLFSFLFKVSGQKNHSIKTDSSSSKTMEQTREVVDSSFTIADDPRDIYKGTYQNDKPHDGFFKVGDDEIFWVEFYRDGEIAKQYSYDILAFLKQLENDEFQGDQRILLDKSAKFEHDEVTEGQFIQKSKNSYLTKTYSDGKTTAVFADFFDIHYYNRFALQILDNKIVFSQLQDDSSVINIIPKDEKISIELKVDDKVVASNLFSYKEFLNPAPNSVVRAFKIRDQVMALSLKRNINVQQHDTNFLVFQKFISSLWKKPMDNPEWGSLLDNLTEALLEESSDQYDEPTIIGFLTTDQFRTIEKGIYWEEQNDNLGNFKIIEKGETVEEGENSLADFQKLIQEYLELL